jgi:hypothetical protein
MYGGAANNTAICPCVELIEPGLIDARVFLESGGSERPPIRIHAPPQGPA